MNNIEEKYYLAKQKVQEWVDKQGHDRCGYYLEIFRELMGIFEINRNKSLNLPPREEFERGCIRYQDEEYGNR